jgi:hypothetical protein
MTSIANPVLQMFRAALDAIYGDRIERVVLYGSQARGNARPDSDYDVAVFLKEFPDRWAELDCDNAAAENKYGIAGDGAVGNRQVTSKCVNPAAD